MTAYADTLALQDRMRKQEFELRQVRAKAFDLTARIAELEAAIDKLAAGKGRYHTEANYLALIAVRNKSLHK